MSFATITLTLRPTRVGGQGGAPIIVALRAAIFDRHVLALDIAGFVQPPAERGHKRCIRAGCRATEVADHRHRLLLRTRGARPRDSGPGTCDQEFAPVHHHLIVGDQLDENTLLSVERPAAALNRCRRWASHDKWPLSRYGPHGPGKSGMTQTTRLSRSQIAPATLFRGISTEIYVARWCAASRIETEAGVFRIRDDEPAPRIGAGLHRTP